MFGFIFKFSLAFMVSFLILSFHLNNKPIFYHLSEITGPLGTEVQSSFGKSMKRGIDKSKKLGKEFLNNANPKYLDEINSQQSSLNSHDSEEMILEDIKKDEAKKLDELINNP